MTHYEGELRPAPAARYAIIASRWNPRITDTLVAAARDTFVGNGVAEANLDVVRYAYDNNAGKDVCQFSSASYLVGGKTLSYAKRIYGNIYSGNNAGTWCGTDTGQACIMRVEGVR